MPVAGRVGNGPAVGVPENGLRRGLDRVGLDPREVFGRNLRTVERPASSLGPSDGGAPSSERPSNDTGSPKRSERAPAPPGCASAAEAPAGVGSASGAPETVPVDTGSGAPGSMGRRRGARRIRPGRVAAAEGEIVESSGPERVPVGFASLPCAWCRCRHPARRRWRRPPRPGRAAPRRRPPVPRPRARTRALKRSEVSASSAMPAIGPTSESLGHLKPRLPRDIGSPATRRRPHCAERKSPSSDGQWRPNRAPVCGSRTHLPVALVDVRCLRRCRRVRGGCRTLAPGERSREPARCLARKRSLGRHACRLPLERLLACGERAAREAPIAELVDVDGAVGEVRRGKGRQRLSPLVDGAQRIGPEGFRAPLSMDAPSCAHPCKLGETHLVRGASEELRDRRGLRDQAVPGA